MDTVHTYDAAKLSDLGYGDDGSGLDRIELSEDDVILLAVAVDGTVEEIESCRV